MKTEHVGNMFPQSNLFDRSHRRRTNVNWRQLTSDHTPFLPSNIKHLNNHEENIISYRNRILSSAKFKVALAITIAIIVVQIFIANHYLSGSLHNSPRSRWPDLTKLLTTHNWLCYSLPHLNKIQTLAEKHQVELVIVDPDVLSILNLGQGSVVANEDVEFSGENYKSHQGPGQKKSILHLAAINETSGGQPNLKSFYKALKNSSYAIMKYVDASQTMQHEVYRRMSNQFDDMQADALRDLRQAPERASDSSAILEISNIYTEFITHIFLLNNTKSEPTTCRAVNHSAPKPFIVIHIFILYNYEYSPDKKWIQSSLRLDEIDRHKLLSYRVHFVDFHVPLEYYYIQEKRPRLTIEEVSPQASKWKNPLMRYKVFKSSDERLLNYSNNTYLHCLKSPFNISGLLGTGHRMSNYLKLLDSAAPIQVGPLKATLDDQLHTALQFMSVLSKTYGNFSFWITGSSLLAYHKFCNLVIMPTDEQMNEYAAMSDSYPNDDHEGGDNDHDPVDNNKSKDANFGASGPIVNLEFGLFADELNVSMLQELSKAAKSIGVTMTSDWRKPNSYISFHVRDCPNMMFNLYLYELRRDFYEYYFITRNNLTFQHKFRRNLALLGRAHRGARQEVGISPNIGQHVFSTNNLKLCWTRIDRLDEFRVPCDVHEHLRRIYVI